MALFIPITKVDAERRLVYGTLSEEVRDKSDEILDYASAKPAFEKWSNEIKEASGGKSLGNVRAMHSAIAAGKLTDLKFDDDAKRIEGVAKIVDDAEWNKVLEGVYTGFSIGGGYARRWPDPDNAALMRYTPTLAEVSIVDNPCVPTATFEYIKADGSVEMRKFITPSHKEDSMDPKALASAKEALAKGTATDEQKALIAQADAELLKAAKDADAKGEATEEQKALLAKVASEEAAKSALIKDGRLMKPQTEPESRWLSKRALEVLEAAGALDEACVKKDDARVRNLILEKQAELAPGLAAMSALLKSTDEKSTESDDEDKDGDDEATKVAKAARREQKTKDAAEKEAAEKAAEIAKQAKHAADNGAANNATPADPLATKTSPADALKKGLYDIGWFANILGDINCFTGNAEWEAMFEGDDSTIPGQLKAWLKQGAALLTAYVAEEASELVGGEDVLAMAGKMDSGHAAALAKFINANFLSMAKGPQSHAPGLQSLADALEKAGARHSKSDKESLMALHKSACDHVDAMEKCFKGMGVMDEDDGDKDANKVNKAILQSNHALTIQVEALSKLLSTGNETMLKAVDEVKASRAESAELQKQNSELVKRVATLEAQPMPGKGNFRTISKTQDTGGSEKADVTAEFEAELAKMSPENRAIALIKVAQKTAVSA